MDTGMVITGAEAAITTRRTTTPTGIPTTDVQVLILMVTGVQGMHTASRLQTDHLRRPLLQGTITGRGAQPLQQTVGISGAHGLLLHLM